MRTRERDRRGHDAADAWLASGEEAAYGAARRKVRMLRAFYRHALVYVVVNAGLLLMSMFSTRHHGNPLIPAVPWGVGLAIHGLIVWSRGGWLEGRWLGRAWEERKIAELLERDQVRTLSTEKQLVEAQLRLLQAQIEPHFLFNTLANVVGLIEAAPQRATLMLEHFIAYLRASLQASRSTQQTVAQEVALLRDYLEILRIRMGDRLHYAIDVEPALAQAPLAPMLLQPVVENAIKHGLEPKIDGGTVRVRIAREQGRMRAVIEDDGLGFKPDASSGVGLANLRERLQVLHDGDAHVRIEEASPGTRVVLDLPLPLRYSSSPTARRETA